MWNAHNPTEQVGAKDKLPYIQAALGVGLIAVGAVAYSAHKRKVPEHLKDASLISYMHVINESLNLVDRKITVGGMPIDAFNDQDTIILPKEKRIIASDSFKPKLIRDNGTTRDVDMLLYNLDENNRPLNISESDLKKLSNDVGSAVSKKSLEINLPAPVISLFSFTDKLSPFYSITSLNENHRVVLKQGLVTQELPEEALEPWELQFADGEVEQVLNPWEQYWRSKIRYSSGIKPKDLDKLSKLEQRLRDVPELAELESSDLIGAYRSFYERMMEQNKTQNIGSIILGKEVNRSEAAVVSKNALGALIMRLGQKFDGIQTFVQSNPQIFNRFGDTK